MIRRSLMLASAIGMATAALMAGPASADTTCVTTDEGNFDGTVICADLNSATSGSIAVPYSIGSTCVAGVCTPAQSGIVYIPRANTNVVRLYGTVCYQLTKLAPPICVTFDSASLIGPIQTA